VLVVLALRPDSPRQQIPSPLDGIGDAPPADRSQTLSGIDAEYTTYSAPTLWHT
jgi:hypothetical protein